MNICNALSDPANELFVPTFLVWGMEKSGETSGLLASPGSGELAALELAATLAASCSMGDSAESNMSESCHGTQPRSPDSLSCFCTLGVAEVEPVATLVGWESAFQVHACAEMPATAAGMRPHFRMCKGSALEFRHQAESPQSNEFEATRGVRPASAAWMDGTAGFGPTPTCTNDDPSALPATVAIGTAGSQCDSYVANFTGGSASNMPASDSFS